MNQRRRLAETRGRRGETLAALYLMAKGWRVLGRRLKTPRGEVDLVVRRGRKIAFVEVKWRARATDLDTAIDAWRLRRVAAAAEVLAARYMREDDTIQIDVILVSPKTWPRHLANCWLG